jgi:hypothetical protein
VKRQGLLLPGALPLGTTPADVNDDYIQGIASSTLAEIDWRTNAYTKSRQKIIRIVQAQKQQVCLLLICIIAVVYCIVYYSNIPLIRYS